MVSIYRGRNIAEFYLASVLYDSIEDLDKRSVVSLIEKNGADANIVLPSRGIAPFHLVVGMEDNEFAMATTRLILQHGGDPNVRSDEGLTPLHIAAAWGRLPIVDVLLRSGADPNLEDNVYKLPIDYAKSENHRDVVNAIRAFVNANIQAIFESRATHKKCTMVLNKILLAKGDTIREYEMDEEPLEVMEEEEGKIDLKILPETTPNEYVRNWFNTLEDEGACFKNVTMRRGKVPLASSTSGHSDGFDERVQNNQQQEAEYGQSERSNESGIHTLPSSMESYAKPEMRVILHKDNSSDYCTCPSDIPEEDAHNQAHLFSCNLNTTEMSFFSVAEVYKYEDDEEDIALYEKHLFPTFASNINETENNKTMSSKSSKASTLPKTFDYDTDTLRNALRKADFEPGPITRSTKRVYLKMLYNLTKNPGRDEVKKDREAKKKVYSNEMHRTFNHPEWLEDLSGYQKLEEQISKQFAHVHPTRHWREGNSKTCFTYLLLDPRITNNLPRRADDLDEGERWRVFLDAVFYVGKGKRSRPYHHLYDAIRVHKKGESKTESAKLQRILDIWAEGHGVVCLHLYQNVIPVEAYTREAAMIAALKLDNLHNLKTGEFYGVAATWSTQQKQMLGVYLLYKAMRIFLNEGERQLSPNDIH